MKRFLLPALALVAVGCASIMHGTSQDIGFQSTPSSAKITVDGQGRGSTPLVVNLSRKNNHVVKMELPGYEPFEATMTRSTSGWVWGNIVFGGLIGLGVDALTGGLYNLNPTQITGQFAQIATQQGKPPETASVTKEGIYVTVVLHADPSWQRIGTLKRAEN